MIFISLSNSNRKSTLKPIEKISRFAGKMQTLPVRRRDNYLMETSPGRRTKINGKGGPRVMAANSNVSPELSGSWTWARKCERGWRVANGTDAPFARNSPLFLRDATTFTAKGSRRIVRPRLSVARKRFNPRVTVGATPEGESKIKDHSVRTRRRSKVARVSNRR